HERATPPFRADHVGSLLRPPTLLRAREQYAAGELDAAALRRIQDNAIRNVIGMQAEVGLRTATDGEFCRTSWHMDFIYSLGGISRGSEQLRVAFRNAGGELEFTSAALKVDGPIRLERTVFGEDFAFLAEHLRP